MASPAEKMEVADGVGDSAPEEKTSGAVVVEGAPSAPAGASTSPPASSSAPARAASAAAAVGESAPDQDLTKVWDTWLD